MKSDDLKNYRQSLLLQCNRYEEAHCKFHQELQAVLNKKQIQDGTFYIMYPNLLSYTFGIKLPQIMIDIISNIQENDPNIFGSERRKFAPEDFQRVGIFDINLETETIEKYPLDEIMKFLDKIYSDLYTEREKITKEKYEINKLIYESNPFINWLKKRNKKVEELSSMYNGILSILDEIQEVRVLFSERNINGIVKTAKDEFEATFGISLILTSKKFNTNFEGKE